MKVQVALKTLAGQSVALDLAVSPSDIVSEIKERVLLAEPSPFPGQTLLLAGKPLDDDLTLADCGVVDGSSLSFVVKSDTEALGQQLLDLISGADGGLVSIEELGLLYTLKHGMPVGDALKALGLKDVLRSFLAAEKRFLVEGDKVKAAPQAKLAPAGKLAVTVLVSVMLPYVAQSATPVDLNVDLHETVRNVKDRAAAAQMVPFAERALLLEGKELPDCARVGDCGLSEASRPELVVRASEEALVCQLAALLIAKGPSSVVELDNMYSYRHGASATQALEMLGWGEKFARFLARHPLFQVRSGCVSLVREEMPVPCSPNQADENQRYLRLLAGLGGEDFSAKLAQDLDRLISVVVKASFLNVRRSTVCGPVAQGTAVPCAPGGEVLLQLEALPPAGLATVLAGLAASQAPCLEEALLGQEDITGVRAEGAALVVATSGPLGEVRMLLAPHLSSYQEVLEALRAARSPVDRAALGAALAPHRSRLLARQPEAVKAAVRLFKHWREDRQWSSPRSRPGDALLELMVAHAVAAQGALPTDLAGAAAKVLDAFANIEKAEVTWPLAGRCYREADICEALRQGPRPLVLDPANPFANLAGAEAFDPAELVGHARAGPFFLA